MNRAALRDELERLGSLPVPLPDPRRVDALEYRLYGEFVVAPSPSAGSRMVAARRRRRQLLVVGLGVAAAATVALAVFRGGGHPGFELDAASGAVMLLPGGHSRAVHAGEHLPSGGLIQTGPAGSVTIGGTKVGPTQIVLVGDKGLTLLPAPEAPETEAPPVEAAPPSTAAVTNARPTPTTALPPTPTAAAADPVVLAGPPAANAGPAADTLPLAPLALAVTEDHGGVHLAWTPTDLAAFERYVVVRGTAAAMEMIVIAELTDRQITSFTDPAAPHAMELLYRVVAVGADRVPIAASDEMQLTLQEGDPSSTIPGSPTSEPSGTALTVPPSSHDSTPTTTGPTDTGPTTTAPATTAPDGTDGPDTSGPDSSGPDSSEPVVTEPPASGRPSPSDPPSADPRPGEPPSGVPSTPSSPPSPTAP